MSLKLVKNKKRSIYDYDDRIKRTFNLIEKELSQNNVELIKKYDRLMILESLAKATRHKHLQTLLNLSRFLAKDWVDAITDDIDNTVMIIHDRYADERGKETNTTYDHKKVLKIFFRWLKLDSRSFTEVGDPNETKHIKMKRVADKISREELITEDDLTRILHVCGENQRDRAFIDCQHEAGTRPGEILSLKIKHVKFDDHGAVIHVDGQIDIRRGNYYTSTTGDQPATYAPIPLNGGYHGHLGLMSITHTFSQPGTYVIMADLSAIPYSNPMFGETSTRFVIQVFDDEGISDVQMMEHMKEDTVDIVGLETPFYVPNTISVSAGERVVFDNVDGNQHTVTSVASGTTKHDGKFDSGLLKTGETFNLTLNEKGTYDYFCALHTNMRGTIIVS